MSVSSLIDTRVEVECTRTVRMCRRLWVSAGVGVRFGVELYYLLHEGLCVGLGLEAAVLGGGGDGDDRPQLRVLRLLVPPQVNLALEGASAQVARERLEARVLPRVRDQVGALGESFAAHGALVRLLAWNSHKNKHSLKKGESLGGVGFVGWRCGGVVKSVGRRRGAPGAGAVDILTRANRDLCAALITSRVISGDGRRSRSLRSGVAAPRPCLGGKGRRVSPAEVTMVTEKRWGRG